MKKHEHWNYKKPRSAAEYSQNCYRRREAKRACYDAAVTLLMMYAIGFFCGVMVLTVALQMAV